MPTLINGLGIWHWGRSNVRTHRRVCTICHRLGHFQSYETTRFLVIAFVPIVPLGKLHVSDECPSCKRHRAISLNKWLKSKTQDVEQAIEAYRNDPSRVEKASTALATTLAYEDEDGFLALTTMLEESVQEDTRLLAELATSYEYFSYTDEAVDAYKRLLAIQPTLETSETLAQLLMHENRPEEAQPYLDHIFEHRIQEKIDLICLAVESYQANGQHDQALAIIERYLSIFPHWEEDKSIKKYRSVSRKYAHSTRLIKSARLLPSPEKVHQQRRWSSVVSVMTPIMVLLVAIGGYVLIAGHAAKHRPVYMVNGLTHDTTVSVNGRHIKIEAESHRLIYLDEGQVNIQAVDGLTGLINQSCQLETNFWTRPFSDHTFILNPDRVAIILWETTEYVDKTIPSAHSNTAYSYDVHAGHLLYTFTGIDYPFQPFPGEIDLPNSKSHTKRIRVGLAAEMSPISAVETIEEHLSEQAVQAYMRQRALLSPNEDDYLGYLPYVLGDQPALAILREGLNHRPIRIEWHRIYQTLLERLDPTHNMAAEYVHLLANDPNNASLAYLAGRVVAQKEAEKLFWQAANANPPCGYGFHALAYARLMNGQFQEALALSRRALAIESDCAGFAYVRHESLLALRMLDLLLAANKSDREQNPLDGDLVAQQVIFLVLAGDDKGAKSAIELFHRRLTQGEVIDQSDKQNDLISKERSGDSDQWLLYLTALATYCRGDVLGYAQQIAHLEGPRWRYESAACLQQFQGLESASDSEELGYDSHLTLFLAARLADDDAVASHHLIQAIELLKLGTGAHRKVAAWLNGDEEMMLSEALGLEGYVSEKRLLLTTLAVQFPRYGNQLCRMARRLNYDPIFPHLLLMEALTQLCGP